MPKKDRQSVAELNQAALDDDMSLKERLRWLWLMMVLGLGALVALWACR